MARARRYPLALQPCEAVTISVSTTANEPPVYYGAAAQLLVYNSSGEELYAKAWGSYPTASETVPNGNLYTAPYRGTRGLSGLPSQMVIKSLSRGFEYTIIVSRSRRPNYNTGGTTPTTATFLGNFPRTIYASIQPTETGQYFRVRVAAGGRIRVTGTAQTSPLYGANLWARLYQPDGSTLVSTLVPAIACYDTCSYTSSWYTNTSGSAIELILRVNAETWMLWDVVMTIEADEGPRLTLFLDADGNFDVNAPSSDHESYVPGSNLASGASVPLPQSLRAIAAYVDSAGAIVAPPYGVTSAAFNLEDTSAFTGIAMNFGGDGGIDYALGGSTALFASDNTARVTLWCYDYGGFTRVRTSDGVAAAEFRLPLDGDGNWIPDILSDSGHPGDDNDDLPTLDGTLGDGLSRFEEFRGFVVQGVHRRTNPMVKDVFIHSQVAGLGIGYAIDLPMTLHEIHDTEMSALRQIAPNFTNTGYGGNIPGHLDEPLPPGPTFRSGQKAIAVYEDLTKTTLVPGSSSFGETTAWVDAQQNPRFGPPWFMPSSGAAYVFTIRIRLASPPNNSGTIPDPPFDDDKLRQTIAHEIGHSLNLGDVQYVHPQPPPSPCPSAPATIMIVNYFTAPAQSIGDCSWNNIPMSFDTSDLSIMRVR
jgi:hypothetical protein